MPKKMKKKLIIVIELKKSKNGEIQYKEDAKD
jgi:hypothetical protein